MTPSMFLLFFPQVTEKLKLEVLDYSVFPELAPLEWFFDLAIQKFPVPSKFQICSNVYVTVLLKCV